MTRYLICKGWEGFCDRLQVLSNCIDLALRYNRILLVDWTDRIWSNGNNSFYDYFDLSNIPYVTSVKDIPKNLNTYPALWNNAINQTTDEWIYNVKDQLIIHPKEIGNHFESVWVHPCIGYREYDFIQLAKHLRLSGKISQIILDRIGSDFQGLPIVHLRGTDRKLGNKKTEENWAKLRALAPTAAILSDDTDLINKWLSESPDSIAASKTAIAGFQAGHKFNENNLSQMGMSKHNMNIQLISDFLLLAQAKEAYALDEESLFFNMARFFGKCGGMKTIFDPCKNEVHLPTSFPGHQFILKK